MRLPSRLLPPRRGFRNGALPCQVPEHEHGHMSINSDGIGVGMLLLTILFLLPGFKLCEWMRGAGPGRASAQAPASIPPANGRLLEGS